MRNAISAIILTHNEEKHIDRCINSIKNEVYEIFVIDSFSTDRTIEIAKKLGAKVYLNEWINYATQFNWALDNCPIETEWVWRIDADEYLAESKESLKKIITGFEPDINGVQINRPVIFQGKLLKHGSMYPLWHLKIFRFGYARCEDKWMDEHLEITEGRKVQIKFDQIDHNLNNISWWTNKHNKYSNREVVDSFNAKHNFIITEENHIPVKEKFRGDNAQRIRWFKSKYSKFPLFVRPFILFIYRYFLRLGFLDGRAGFIWHVLQGFWYRFLIDVKIYELRKRFDGDEQKIISYLKEKYNL